MTGTHYWSMLLPCLHYCITGLVSFRHDFYLPFYAISVPRNCEYVPESWIARHWGLSHACVQSRLPLSVGTPTYWQNNIPLCFLFSLRRIMQLWSWYVGTWNLFVLFLFAQFSSFRAERWCCGNFGVILQEFQIGSVRIHCSNRSYCSAKSLGLGIVPWKEVGNQEFVWV